MMQRLVTGYFVWDLAVWSAIFFFSAFCLVFFLNQQKKKGVFVAGSADTPETPLPDVAESKASRFLKETLCWWLAREQAQLLLFAVLLLFFAVAVFGGTQS